MITVESTVIMIKIFVFFLQTKAVEYSVIDNIIA